MDERLKDFHLRIQKIGHVDREVNRGIEFVLVIEGELTIETSSRIYQMKEKDLLVINRNELFEMKGNKENSVLRFTISDLYMEQSYKDYRYQWFECFSQNIDIGREALMDQLRTLFGEMVITFYRKDDIYTIEMQRIVSEILLILIRRFKEEGNALGQLDTEDDRLVQLIDYMERHYQEQMTLEQMAHMLYMSPGYLSRYFKRKMGVGFSRFLMDVRLRHSVKDLLYTTDSIASIAMNNGFPNTKSFTSLFKEIYEETPKIYRERHKKENVNIDKTANIKGVETITNSSSIFLQLGSMLAETNKTYSNTETRFEELRIDVSVPSSDKITRPDHVLIVRELKELLKEDIREQVLTVKENLRLSYIGIQNLVSNATFLPTVETDEAIATSSPYFKADMAINFLKKHDLAIFSRVSYQDISVDEASYFKKLEEFLRHCLQVFGEYYVSKWHVLFYESYFTAVEPKELCRMYKKLYSSIKKIVPGIHIGVYLPFSYKEEKTSNRHTWILQEDDRIDFIGFHANQNEVIDFEETSNDRFLLAKDYIKEKTNKVKYFLKQHHIDKPLHLVTWNTLSGNTRYTNGTFFRGALVLKSAWDISNDVDSLAFWINTELHEVDDQYHRIQLEGMELFHYFNGKRPAFYAMSFAEKLSGSIVAQGPDFIMTEYERGYQLVLMNCINVNPYFSIEDAFLKKLNKDIRVIIEGLKPGEYQVRKYTYDKDNGALYTNWWNLGSKHGVDIEIAEYIHRLSHPSLQIFDETIDGDWSFYSYLTINAIHFFDIRKSYV
ncbi:helix-turn-helix domain-containing protein [Psychrobacillus lasiicapitis]|uniref:Helix-turn-helix domain-containing protein n=1 Tax=Psychrobacillus lasiicapitis TaxID=1636719 RepID=A0A544T736_9BACI|nr:helix-turn-helix domain-containing protein [Psychrobacillus lasiicapitis]TQR13260.1 helix-turn-helix domain-containing protein [Psychrobacillus lasiicapitis]GGA33158.1 AraC family transcriptional regulator [Psychrobacillus lasiicapitis]